MYSQNCVVLLPSSAPTDRAHGPLRQNWVFTTGWTKRWFYVMGVEERLNANKSIWDSRIWIWFAGKIGKLRKQLLFVLVLARCVCVCVCCVWWRQVVNKDNQAWAVQSTTAGPTWTPRLVNVFWATDQVARALDRFTRSDSAWAMEPARVGRKVGGHRY